MLIVLFINDSQTQSYSNYISRDKPSRQCTPCRHHVLENEFVLTSTLPAVYKYGIYHHTHTLPATFIYGIYSHALYNLLLIVYGHTITVTGCI